MDRKTIALLHPGEMGAAIGAGLVEHGQRVVWVGTGRGEATRRRATSCGLEDVQTLARATQSADVVLSVCPPHAAVQVAREVAACGFGGIYVDANAVATETTREIGRVIEAAGASYVDAGIIGLPPAAGVSVRLYLCGEHAARVAALFEGCIIQAIVLDGPIGAASALKICYAGWNKCATALLAVIRTFADREGVDAALLAEWDISQPDIPKRSEIIRRNARKAWRWIGEMEEIASSLEAAGLPGGFHLAAADIFRKLEGFKGASQPVALSEVKSALLRR